MIEQAGARRCELHHPEVLAQLGVGVDREAELVAVEVLRALDVRDGDHEHLECHVHRPDASCHHPAT
jgi:hypothetical protein